MQVTCPPAFDSSSSPDPSFTFLPPSVACRSKKKVSSPPPAPATTDRSSSRNATVHAHDAQPAEEPEPYKSARTNQQTTFLSAHSPTLPRRCLSEFPMIKTSFETPHVWPVQPGSDHRPSHHSPPKLRLPNHQRAELSFADRSHSATSSSVRLLPGRICTLSRFVWPISLIPQSFPYQIPQPAN